MKKTVDERPKQDIARSVVTPKRMYFVPDSMSSVEASSIEEAVKKSKKKKEEVGDVNK